jgi:hypothetical protein
MRYLDTLKTRIKSQFRVFKDTWSQYMSRNDRERLVEREML